MKHVCITYHYILYYKFNKVHFLMLSIILPLDVHLMFSSLHCNILWHCSTPLDIPYAMSHYATASNNLVQHAHKTGLTHWLAILIGGELWGRDSRMWIVKRTCSWVLDGGRHIRGLQLQNIYNVSTSTTDTDQIRWWILSTNYRLICSVIVFNLLYLSVTHYLYWNIDLTSGGRLVKIVFKSFCV
jgi:hypothetical protein